MKRRTKLAMFPLLAVFALLILQFIPALSILSAQAANGETTGDIGYYVRAVLPENQIDDTLTYFDLLMEPGGTQQLEVEVVNETEQTITVDIQAISASTNRNGVIDYKTPNVRDKTLKTPFSDLVELEAESLTIEPGGTAMAKAGLSMPREEYDGVVLGGLVFTRRMDDNESSGEGMVLQNIYSYVLGVKLTETDTPVLPDFELEGIQAESVNYQPSMVHYIRNKEAAIAKGIDLSVTIWDKDGNEVTSVEKNGMDMAPNSVMPLAVVPSGSGEDTLLAPGEYTSETILEHDGQSWSFLETFTVGSVEAENINAAVPGAGMQQSSGILDEVWLLVLLSALAAIILALLVVILLLLRRRKKEKETDEREVYYKKRV